MKQKAIHTKKKQKISENKEYQSKHTQTKEKNKQTKSVVAYVNKCMSK